MSNRSYMTVCSEKTLQSNSKGFFMQFAAAAAENAGRPWIKNVFGKLKTDAERIRIIYQDPAIKDVVLETLSHVQEIYRKKSAEVSQAKRMDAEKAFKAGEDMKALMLSSQSVLRAPKTGLIPRVDNGISLALALWSRSEILMRLKNYTLALNDIQQALKEGLHASYKSEAFLRMAICYKAKGEEKKCLVSVNLAEKLLEKNSKSLALLKESIAKDYKEAKRSDSRVLPQVPKPNPDRPYATGKMEVKFEESKGRYAVAAADISTGEIIVCEPPHAACLLPECFGTHCHHCFNRLESPIGCPDCSSVAFCNAECRDKAINNYHKYECKFLDLLIGSGMSILSHAALRMVTQNTPEKMYDANKDRSTDKVYAMCTLAEKRKEEDFLQRTLMAAFLLRCLQKSGYFGYVDENVVPNENQLGVGELLLFNLQMLQFNAHEIYETKRAETHRFKNAVANYIGVAVYPTASLLNHDCYPSVTRHFVGKNIVITAARPLKTGETIAENYGPIFTRRVLADRQRSLAGRYWFKCNCTACGQNWPSLETGLETLSKRVRCPTVNCTNFFTLPLANESAKCPRCEHKVSLTSNILQLKICEEQYVAGFDCLEKQDPQKGILLLCRAIDNFYKVSAPPHRDTHLAQECLRAFYADNGNVFEVRTTTTQK